MARTQKSKVLQAFLGNYEVNLLTGFRIVLPAGFRNLLKQGLVITKGIENNLYVFDLERWSTIIKPLTAGSILDSKVRSLLRYLVAYAFVLKPDSQGRIVIPSTLRGFSKQELVPGETLVIAGLYNWIEIWVKADWERNINQLEHQVSDLADLLANVGEVAKHD